MNYRRNEDKWPVAPYYNTYNDVISTSVLDGATGELIPVEPITLVEAKTHMKVDFADEDTYITGLITQCRGLMETATGRSLVTKTVIAIVRNERGDIELPYGPVRSITSVFDEDNTELILLDEDYELRGLDFLTVYSPLSTYTKFTYTAGHTTANMPRGLKQALLELISYHYHHRGDNEVTAEDYNKRLHQLAAPFKRHSWLL